MLCVSVNPKEERLRMLTNVTSIVNRMIDETSDKSKKEVLRKKKEKYNREIEVLVKDYI